MIAKSTTTADRVDLLKRARAYLAALRLRANGDPTADPFAAKIQAIERCRASGRPTYDPVLLRAAMSIHDDLSPARKAANRAMLLGTDMPDDEEAT